MKLIHITDIHLTREGESLFGKDPGANFRACLDHVAAHHADADLAVITGDLTHWGESAAYARLKRLIEDFPLPLRLMIGNHDDRGAFRRAFPEAPVDPNGFVQWSETTAAGRFIYLDTVQAMTHAGHFCGARQAWLRAALEAAGDQPCYLFMHHNPMPIGITAPDAIGLVHTEAFRRILLDHAGIVRHLFFGHCHMPLSGAVAGVPFASLRGTNHHGWQDFTGASMLKQADLTPLYSVVLLDGPDCVVHAIDYSYDGSILEFGTAFEDWAKRADGQGAATAGLASSVR